MSNEKDILVFNTIIEEASKLNNNANISDAKKKEELIKFTKELYLKKDTKGENL